MLPTSVIIVLREVLEAALLISMLGAVSQMLGLSRRWAGPGIGIGLLGALTYSLGIDSIAQWFDGFGQEFVSATMQALIYLLLVSIALLTLRRARHEDASTRYIPMLMALAVALALTREGFEILVYLYGFSSIFSQLVTVSMGAIIGAGIGISLCAVVLCTLSPHSPTYAFHWFRLACVIWCRIIITGDHATDPGGLAALATAVME